jgi:Phosphotransferase enzyme family
VSGCLAVPAVVRARDSSCHARRLGQHHVPSRRRDGCATPQPREVRPADRDKEHRWLPIIAPQLPLPIHSRSPRAHLDAVSRRRGRSIGGCRASPPALLARRTTTDSPRTSADSSLPCKRVKAAGGPPPGAHSFNRGGPVATWDEQARATIAELGDEVDGDGATAVWEAALAAEWNGPDVWVHGDVIGSNLLFRHDRLSGVIDFGCAAVGDPACDLTPAWTMFEGTSRQRFRSTVRADAGTWARARGWARWKALIDAPGRPPGDPALTGALFGWRWNALGVIDRAIADLRSSSGARTLARRASRRQHRWAIFASSRRSLRRGRAFRVPAA